MRLEPPYDMADPPPLGKLAGQGGCYPASHYEPPAGNFERRFELFIFLLANLVFIALDVWVLSR